MVENYKVQKLFLLLMTTVYLFAFLSLFIQIPGLYGHYGILPVKLALNRESTSVLELLSKQPTLLHLLPIIGISDSEVGFNILCFCGVILSLIAFIFEGYRNSFTFFFLWALYQSLFQVGQIFLWFQWDTLLLEIGFLSILIAPSGICKTKRLGILSWKESGGIFFWLVKWLTFRLMFCSGVVKLLSGCHTWWTLTAMNYHYESQCIPTPLAWYAHVLSPPTFQKLSIALVFLIQIGTSVFFFSPVRIHRILSFFIQSFLMVLILLTGNYNFFNWVSIIMCLSLLDDQFYEYFKSKNKNDLTRSNSTTPRYNLSQIFSYMGNIIFMATLWFFLNRYFSFTFLFNLDPTITFSMEDLKYFLEKFVPITIWIAGLSLFFEFLISNYRTVRKNYKNNFARIWNLIGNLLTVIIALIIFLTTLVPYTNIERGIQSKLPQNLNSWFQQSQRIHIFNAYGLFRSMTGVGGRPEVILEGSDNVDSGWQEFNFIYKLGDINRAPPFVAPHQPRVDWQMWFAALGSYQYNPWFLHLAYRILTNQKEVLALMDEGPFETHAPKYLRAHLYHYHYTTSNHTDKNQWWTRNYIREYLPIISLEDPYLINYMKNNGMYKDMDLPEYPQKKPFIVHFFEYLHSLANPRQGLIICLLPLFFAIFYKWLIGRYCKSGVTDSILDKKDKDMKEKKF